MRHMASDPKAKPPPPEIIVEATEWPHFLQLPVDPGERVRHAQQAVDEQREREFELANKQQTIPARKGKSAKRRREVELFMKVAGTLATKTTAWQVAGDAFEQVNKHRKLDHLDELPTRDPIYRVVRIPSNWSRLTSLRKR
jgi:hypothetical protein